MIKKLFTSILLLGAVGYAQAQVTVTGYDDSNNTVTINYESGDFNKEVPRQVIEQYLRDNKNWGSEDVKNNVKVIKFTGNWNNSHLTNGGSIYDLVNYWDSKGGVGLDLSACDKMFCKFRSVKDVELGQVIAPDKVTTGIEDNRIETTFTYDCKGIVEVEVHTGAGWFTENLKPVPDYVNLERDTQLNSDGTRTWTGWDGYNYGQHTLTYLSGWFDSNNTFVTSNNDDVTEKNGKNYANLEADYGDFKFDGYSTKIKSISFPQHENFDFIPNSLFKENKLIQSVVIPEGIVGIGNEAFAKTNIKTVTFPSTLRELGGDAFVQATLLEGADLSDTQITRLRWCTFQDASSLATLDFPETLIEIQKDACQRTRELLIVDLSMCHGLQLIAQDAFQGKSPDEGADVASKLSYVKICSHPKVIKGGGGSAEGAGAFFHDRAIKTVEIVDCGNDVTECICENRAFDVNITYGQTNTVNVEACATLIYPKNGNVPSTSDYTSSFDFFVGEYKSGVLLTHEALLAYYRNVPVNGTDNQAKRTYWNGTQYVDETYEVTCMYQKGNGWHEFLNVGVGEIVPQGEFLRTYSRTVGEGPCILSKDIKAYRAIDYESTATGFVYDKKNGTHVLINPEVTNEADRIYKEISKLSPEEKELYKNNPKYSELTIGGKILLKPLVPKLAYYEKDGEKIEGYTTANKAFFDNLMVNDVEKLMAVPGTGRNIISYVPENTGVVLYSSGTDEDAFLMLPGYTGTDLVLTEYRHSEGRYEENRLNSENKSDNINMLQGSYGTGCGVAPCYPWIYDDPTAFSGGHYDTTVEREYRNFACVWSDAKSSTGKDIKTYGWKRLTPSKLIPNRAYASIPVGRFDNFNETADQMPDFYLEDRIVDESNANMILLTSFDEMIQGEGETDAIKTVNTTIVNTNDDAWYTIQGVRVAQPTKGIYIHNNKKVVIK